MVRKVAAATGPPRRSRRIAGKPAEEVPADPRKGTPGKSSKASKPNTKASRVVKRTPEPATKKKAPTGRKTGPKVTEPTYRRVSKPPVQEKTPGAKDEPSLEERLIPDLHDLRMRADLDGAIWLSRMSKSHDFLEHFDEWNVPNPEGSTERVTVWWEELPKVVRDTLQDEVVQLMFRVEGCNSMGREGFELPRNTVRRIAKMKRGPKSSWKPANPKKPEPAWLAAPDTHNEKSTTSYGYVVAPDLVPPPDLSAVLPHVLRDLRAGNLFIAPADGSIALWQRGRRLQPLLDAQAGGPPTALTIQSPAIPQHIRDDLQLFFFSAGALMGPKADRLSVPAGFVEAIAQVGRAAPYEWLWPPPRPRFVQLKAVREAAEAQARTGPLSPDDETTEDDM